jgi:NAD+ synthase (glutamine-hydrolysing)
LTKFLDTQSTQTTLTMKPIRIAGAALNQTPLDWANNLDNILKAIEVAKKQHVKILCLPELCITGYSCEDLFLAEWFTEKALSTLNVIQQKCDGITVSVGLPVRIKDKLYNCACLINNQQIMGFTAKQFLANDGIHYEHRWFTPWKAGNHIQFSFEGKNYPFGDIIYEIDGIKTAFEICEDAWITEERPAIRHELQQVELILNPSASHFALQKSLKREELVVSSSKQFKCTYVYANLVGNEAGRIIFDGEILIAQKGKLLQENSRLSFKNTNITYADVDFSNPEKSIGSKPNDIHDKNIEFTQAVTLGLFDYLRKSKSKGFVLSLSGGADSSACAVLVADMVKNGITELGTLDFLTKLGQQDLHQQVSSLSLDEQIKKTVKKILICVYQSTPNSSEATFNSARELAKSIGATFYYWEIGQEVTSYTHKIEKAIGRQLTWEQDDITLQNIQARARAPIAWMLANIYNSLLITTSNRSEGDVGYATMDGDTAGSLAPIAGIDKAFLLQWLKWAEKHLGYKGLQHVNTLTPSAELRPLERHQSDEADLMPYSIIVEIERLAIGQYLSPKQVYLQLKERKLEADDLLKTHIEKFFRMWARNQWKRERIAPSFHLDEFNIDPRSWYRFPILSGSFMAELEEIKNIP